jgi:hypothetical protein
MTVFVLFPRVASGKAAARKPGLSGMSFIPSSGSGASFD